MSPVELIPIEGALVLRARGSELLILAQYVAELKKLTVPKEFASYFMQEALINRPARKLFEAWLRKDRTLWKRIYDTVMNEIEVKEIAEPVAEPASDEVQEEAQESEPAEEAVVEKKEAPAKTAKKVAKKKASTSKKKSESDEEVKPAKKKAAKKKAAKKKAAKKKAAKKKAAKKVSK